MHFEALPAHPSLSRWVHGYWFIEDLESRWAGGPIRTSAHPGAALTIHLARPNSGELAPHGPRATLLGLQRRSRLWWSHGECYFVMVMLTTTGLASLFPSTGLATADRALELAALIGARRERQLVAELSAAWTPHAIARRLDHWLTGHAARSPEPVRFAEAARVLKQTLRVSPAAEAAQISARQLDRWFQRHLGVSPRELLGLERIHLSLRAAQTRQGDPAARFSDQAHQIRAWQRHLGTSPGRYSKTRLSPLASHFIHDPEAGQERLAHFL
jgi:AraC-like DNA-binding protein